MCGRGRRLTHLLGRQPERCGYSSSWGIFLHQRRTRLHLRNTQRPFCRVLGRQRLWSGHTARRTVHLPRHRTGTHVRRADRPHGRLLGSEHSGRGDPTPRAIHLRERRSSEDLRDQEGRDRCLLGRDRETLTPSCRVAAYTTPNSSQPLYAREGVVAGWLAKGDCTTNVRADGGAVGGWLGFGASPSVLA